MLVARNISKSYKGQTVLADVSFAIAERQKIALVGYNGSGKSTLLKILAGIEPHDAGLIERINQPRIGYLPQEINLTADATIEQYLKQGTGLDIVENKMRLGMMNNGRLPEGSADPQQQYDALDGNAFNRRAKLVLTGFGLTMNMDRPIKSLSGGQQAKVMIAGLLLAKPDILLMDEPTNNLDLPAVIWLEKYLSAGRCAGLIVSHDRKFLDAITSKTLEIDWFTRRLNEFPGAYSEYLNFRQAKIDREVSAAQLQQREQKEIIKSINEKKRWAARGRQQETTDNDKYIRGRRRDRAGKSAKKATVMKKQLTKKGDPQVTPERVRLDIPLVAKQNDAKHSVHLEQVKFTYPTGFKLGPLNCHFKYGSRIGIIGLNGSGKTTLLRILSGEIEPSAGRLSVGRSLLIGNLTQAHDNLPPHKTLLEYLVDQQGIDTNRAFLLLVKFNFSVHDAKKSIGTLSPGERARLLFLVFSEKQINVLILDEPTNHLDLEALAALSSALQEYTGTIILVSHDRAFLEGIEPDTLYLLDNGRMEMIDDYQKYINAANADAERLLRALK